jgi:site-specific DNA recombinase
LNITGHFRFVWFRCDLPIVLDWEAGSIAQRRRGAAVSQWEREAIGERTRDALRHKRGNGERVGNIEFGYRLSPDRRHLEPDPTEQAALAEIRNLRRQGYTLRGIAATLNKRGHRTRRGTQWRLESVARVMKQNALPPHAKTT